MMRRTLRVREGMTMSCPYRRSWIAIAVAVCLAAGSAWAQAPTVEPPVEPPLVADAEPDGAVGRSYWPLVFDGTNDYIVATDASTADEFDVGTGPISIAAWVKFTSLTGEVTIITKRPSNSANYWAFWVDGGVLKFTSSGTATSSATFATGVWYHLGVVRSGTTTTFYVNGVPETKTGVTQGNITNTGPISIGAASAVSAGYIKAAIAFVRIWNSGRSTAQMQTEYANRNPFAVATVTPTWGAAFLPGSGQTVVQTWGNAVFTLGSTAGVDTNDPTWGTRQFAGRQIQ